MSPPHPALLRAFYTPASPLSFQVWNGHPDGPGIYTEPREPASFADLAKGVVELEAGVTRFSFDPERVIARLASEAHFPRRRPLHSYLPFESAWIPERLREMLLRLSVRRRLGTSLTFPRWPVEPCVEELRALVWNAAQRAGVAGTPEPFWPEGKTYAAVLSHDLDAPEVYRQGYWKQFAELEEAHGLRSSWHFCSEHIQVAGPVLEELARRGHEIAWQGVRHDYRIAYLPPAWLKTLIEEHQALLTRFAVQGFRSPFYLRPSQLYQGLTGAFRYDSSARDTAPEFFSPYRREGCCTVFPFFREDVVELPISIPEDHYISCLVGDHEEEISRIQLAKLEWIRNVGGLAVVLTHPVKWISLKPGAFRAYRKLVEHLAKDSSACMLLARDAAAWWRKRFCPSPETTGSTGRKD